MIIDAAIRSAAGVVAGPPTPLGLDEPYAHHQAYRDLQVARSYERNATRIGLTVGVVVGAGVLLHQLLRRR